MSYRGRFAPSPTGRLHFGSLIAALGSWLRAKSQEGVWLVRIEDVDQIREVPGAAENILATLDAFGLQADETIVRQSTRFALYEDALQRLRDRDLAYPCWCSRTDLAPYRSIHPDQCIAAPSANRAPAWRARISDETVRFEDAVRGCFSQDLKSDVGDFVLRRVDGAYSYQLAVAIDDDAQGITEVVRGADLLDSTPRQIFLQRLLGIATPNYLHLPVALDEHGRKLSKHEQARAVDPENPLPALREALAFLGQCVPEATTVDAFLRAAIRNFDVGRIPHRRYDDAALRKD
jgi:glutamyl-Q tRNA(Asp) synthetase